MLGGIIVCEYLVLVVCDVCCLYLLDLHGDYSSWLRLVWVGVFDLFGRVVVVAMSFVW